jgi:DNA mismatch endonuclease (patch repair protein)
MIDRVSEERRSYIMSRVGSKDTAPEWTVRRLLHRLGYRYRLHARHLPGRPDLSFPARRKVVFVHGCFWHGHDCRYGRLPKSRIDYWRDKIAANRARDLDRILDLAGLGWSALVVWQCETRDPDNLAAKLTRFLGPPGTEARRETIP